MADTAALQAFVPKKRSICFLPTSSTPSSAMRTSQQNNIGTTDIAYL
jgi:hypothetical protein